MIYKGIDRWSSPNYLDHKDHKYFMKIGKGENARYFYSQEEYQAYMDKARAHKGKDYSEDTPWNTAHTTIDRSRTMYVHTNDKGLGGQSRSGLKKTGASYEMSGGVIGGDPKGYDIYGTEVYTPHVSKNDKDPRWAINQSYKPKATKTEKAVQVVKNKKARFKNAGRKNVEKFLKGLFSKNR